jgi:2,4-dienoyl-CoA reductase-like NADH-dependent reductase (Old Yellow Enzyme family)
MLKKVWEPIRINTLEVKNRIGLPSMVNMPGGEEGFISDLTIRWYELRAAGGANVLSWFGSPGNQVELPELGHEHSNSNRQ